MQELTGAHIYHTQRWRIDYGRNKGNVILLGIFRWCTGTQAKIRLKQADARGLFLAAGFYLMY